MSKLTIESFILASGFYLTDTFPEDVGEWNYDQIRAFIEQHKWHLTKPLDSDELFDMIEEAAKTIETFALSKMVKL
jgi:hypothetical protein